MGLQCGRVLSYLLVNHKQREFNFYIHDKVSQNNQ